MGRPVRAPAGARPGGPGPLRCSPSKCGSAPRPRMAGTTLARRAYARSSTSSPSRRLGGGAMPLGGLRCSAPSTRAPACPPAALPHRRGMPMEHLGRVPQSRGWVCGGATYAAPRSGRSSWPRAQRASSSDSSRLFEHSERSERSEFRDGPRVRAPQGTLRAAKGCRITSAAAHPPAALLAQLSAVTLTEMTQQRKPQDLRSARWFAPDDFRSFGHRSRVMQMGYAAGRLRRQAGDRDRQHLERRQPVPRALQDSASTTSSAACCRRAAFRSSCRRSA